MYKCVAFALAKKKNHKKNIVNNTHVRNAGAHCLSIQ